MNETLNETSVDRWFRACREMLQIRLEAMTPKERAEFLLGLNARILEFSAFEIALVRDPGSAAHLIRMAAELDRMIESNTVIPFRDAGNI